MAKLFKIGGVSIVTEDKLPEKKKEEKEIAAHPEKDGAAVPLSDDSNAYHELATYIINHPMPVSVNDSANIPQELIVAADSEPTLEDIEAQAEKAKQHFLELEAKKKELIKLKELSKPIVMHLNHVSGGMLIVELSDTRDDVNELVRMIPGRAWIDTLKHSIPLAEWEKAKADFLNLPNTSVKVKKEIEEEIHFILHAPIWEVEKHDKYLTAKPGPRAYTQPLFGIPGADYIRDKKLFRVPLPEAHKLFETLKDVEGVVWSEEASEFAIKQVEARAMLDKIATLTDYEYDVDLKNGVLRPFQKVGCGFVEATQGRALVAYEMGLGKTWISLAYAIKNNFRVVVICPAALKSNWAREIKKLAGEKPSVLQGGEPLEHDMIQMVMSPPKFTIINYDILGRNSKYENVTVDAQGYDHVERKERFLWVDLINLSKPDLVIFDESHYIKNTDSNRSKAARQINCQRVIHMTGTPVLNRPGELWPILTMLAPAQFPSEDAFLKHYTYDGKRARNVDELKNILKTVMIRRLKKDVIADMPLVNRIYDYHELSPKALKLYRKVEAGVYETIDAYKPGQGGSEKEITSILAQIQRLKQICAIDKIDGTADKAVELYDQTDPSEHRKVLIFTQFKAVAHAITQRLGNEAIGFVRWSGSDYVTANNQEQDRLVQRFQNDPDIHFLVVTEKTAKEGHNITAAGHVIFNDLFWTPAGHAQSEGRAYGRLSDLHGINSYYRITDMDGSSIEEWIMDLLAGKMAVIEEVIEAVESSRNADVSIVSELIEKMRGMMWTKKKR